MKIKAILSTQHLTRFIIMNIQSTPIEIHLSPATNHRNSEIQFPNGEDHHNRVLTEKRQSVSSNPEKLADKFFSASFGDRTKRSTPPSTQLPVQQLNVDEARFLSRYEDIIRLNSIRAQKPVCLRVADGSPNPSVPVGYASWEAFLASEGQGNRSIMNPREEVRDLLSTAAINFLIREEFVTIASYKNAFSDFERKLNSTTSRESAISQFEQFKEKVDNAYVTLLFKRKLLLNVIIQKMAEALRAVRLGTPNRWIESQCWSFTPDEQLWNQRWTGQELPKALRAIFNESNSDLEYIIKNRRNEYLNKGMNALRSHIASKRWQPYSVSGAEDLPLPVVPALRQNTPNTQPAGVS